MPSEQSTSRWAERIALGFVVLLCFATALLWMHVGPVAAVISFGMACYGLGYVEGGGYR